MWIDVEPGNKYIRYEEVVVVEGAVTAATRPKPPARL